MGGRVGEATVGVPRRKPWRHPDPDPVVLRRLYVQEHRTERDIAQLLGISRAHVADALAAAGIERRRSAKPCPVGARTLARLYRAPGASAGSLARHFGVASATILRWLAEVGLLAADPAIDHGLLRKLYVERRRTVEEVAQKLQVSRARVQRELAVAGIPARSNHARRPRGNRARLTDARLRRLYVNEQRGVLEIAELFGVSTEYLSKRLRELGLIKRSPGSFGSRGPMPIEKLRELAAELYGSGLTMREVGGELEVSVSTVRQALHDAQVPVRRSGGRSFEDPPRTLIDDLYADRAVCRVLRRHGVRIPESWAPTGPFESLAPLPVSGELLADLYDEVGLAMLHIAMVLGVGQEAVRRGLLRAGVELRPRSELAPWTARRAQEQFALSVDEPPRIGGRSPAPSRAHRRRS